MSDTCEKCGQDAYPLWHIGGWDSIDRPHCYRHQLGGAPHLGEHLHYICGCGYEWTTETKDAEITPERFLRGE